jgi:HSP20 family protein
LVALADRRTNHGRSRDLNARQDGEKEVHERTAAPQAWHPIDTLRNEIDRLFESFDKGFWRSPFRRSTFDIEPFWRGELSWGATPAVDIAEKDNRYEITADLPGLDEKDVEVKLTNGHLTITGEKREDKEEKKKNYYLHERRFGSFVCQGEADGNN